MKDSKHPTRARLIVNPISGTSDKKTLVPRIEQRIAEMGYTVDTRYTQGRGDATALASEAARDGYDVVAVCGGDGTVNEAARALCDTEVAMAIIPAGSGNGLARHIGLPSDPLAALDVMAKHNISACDYGTANGHRFFCAFGIGFDAAVTKNFAEQSRRGFNTYIKSAFQEFFNYHPRNYTLEIDGRTIERKAYLVACCNASQYGNNAFIAPRASITDGVLDVVILRDAPHIQTLLAGIDLLTGNLPHNRQVEVIRTTAVTIHQEDTAPAHADGEPLHMPADIDVRLVPGRLHIFSDPNKKPFTPFITPIEYMTRDWGIAFRKILK